jgi:hypothetical protein
MKTAKVLGLRCADIDPAERGRVDRIGIPQRKKTGSPTAAMGLNSVDFAMATLCPLIPRGRLADIGERLKVPKTVP